MAGLAGSFPIGFKVGTPKAETLHLTKGKVMCGVLTFITVYKF